MTVWESQLKCEDCGNEFPFTEEEQTFFREKGFEHPPKRCPDCRKKRRDRQRDRGPRSGGGGFRGRKSQGPRPNFSIVCNACGKEASVPFKPTPGRAVFCPDCHQKQKGSTPEPY